MGLDLSTQQLKVTATTAALQTVLTYHVEFDKHYKNAYGVTKGVIASGDGAISSPVLMWLDALDHVFSQMKATGFPFDRVAGISGSGMQHGSVFWSADAAYALANMDLAVSLREALNGKFTSELSPNWQDHSTAQERHAFETVAGGADALAEKTGSRAHFRFTGLQIRKLAMRSGPDVYRRTARISLVSSFLTSVFLGQIAGIEEADACGMNLYNIAAREFDDELLAVAAGVHASLDSVTAAEQQAGVQELKRKLGPVIPVGYAAMGTISGYFCTKYGFAPQTKIYSFTGDNLATIISLPLEKNDVLVSLGTSTTVLLVTELCVTSSQYHLFRHPTMASVFMGMICYCNGSLAREQVRDQLNNKHGAEHDSWERFNAVLDASQTFNNELGIYFPLGEIVPTVPAQYSRARLVDGKVDTVDSWPVEKDVTSIVESQTISCRVRAGPLLCSSSISADELEPQLATLYRDLHACFGNIYTDGKRQTAKLLMARPRNVYFVGGASRNTSITRKMGSILGATNGNYQVENPNACALGGAYKASWSHHCEDRGAWVDFNEYLRKHSAFDNLKKLDVADRWIDYLPAVGMLAHMERVLTQN